MLKTKLDFMWFILIKQIRGKIVLLKIKLDFATLKKDIAKPILTGK